MDTAQPEGLSCPRTIAERFGCGLQLLEFGPTHSGSQRFVDATVANRTFIGEFIGDRSVLVENVNPRSLDKKRRVGGHRAAFPRGTRRDWPAEMAAAQELHLARR